MFEAMLAPTATVHVEEFEPAEDARLDTATERMLSAALRLENEVYLEGVIEAAKLAFPDQQDAIDAYVAEMQTPTEPLMIEALVVTAPVPEPPEQSFLENFSGKLTINAAYAEGNTDLSSLGARLNVSAKRAANIHRVDAYANTGENAGQRTQENWGVSYQMDTLWTDDVFGYFRTSYDSDPFLGFEYRLFGGAGAGYYLIQEETLSLRGEVGPGLRFSKETGTGAESQDWVIYGSIDSNWQINSDWTLSHASKVTWSDPSTNVTSRSELNTALTEALRAGLTYEVQYEENPPNQKENVDTIISFNVSYGF